MIWCLIFMKIATFRKSKQLCFWWVRVTYPIILFKLRMQYTYLHHRTIYIYMDSSNFRSSTCIPSWFDGGFCHHDLFIIYVSTQSIAIFFFHLSWLLLDKSYISHWPLWGRHWNNLNYSFLTYKFSQYKNTTLVITNRKIYLMNTQYFLLGSSQL